MRIAYVGIKGGTSLQRAKALERIGHEVTIIDPFSYLAPSRVMMSWVVRTGALGASLYAYPAIGEAVKRASPELVWVDHGAFLGPALIRSFRRAGVPVINYMVDNPFAQIYRMKCRHYRAALPYYDLAVQLRDTGAALAHKAGARNVYRAHHTADEIAHSPRPISDGQRSLYSSEVAFGGTWFPERGAFLAELIHHGVPLSIWGNYWKRAPEWEVLAPHWRGAALNDDDSYAAAIQSAKICIGLLSEEVEDQVTSRSFEIPALGTLLCAKRTKEHLHYFGEGEEAVFWEDATECAKACLDLLADEERRRAIAWRGRDRALRDGYFNEVVLRKILAESLSCWTRQDQAQRAK